MKDDQLYINQLRDSIRKIESYIKGINLEVFLTDEKTQSAVILQLLLIGEVSKKVSGETKAKYELPWKQITGFRDRAIHNYFEISLKVVWDTLTEDIPLLKKVLGSFTLKS